MTPWGDSVSWVIVLNTVLTPTRARTRPYPCVHSGLAACVNSPVLYRELQVGGPVDC